MGKRYTPAPPRARDEYVPTGFDTGAVGDAILYGRVIASGPKCYRVVWESGLTNRIRQGDHNVETAGDAAQARHAMRRITA